MAGRGATLELNDMRVCPLILIAAGAAIAGCGASTPEPAPATRPAGATGVVPERRDYAAHVRQVEQRLKKAAPETARVLLNSKGIGSSSAVEATLALSPQGGGTRVHWVVEVKELGGLLKMVPAGLIRGAAQKVVNDAWAAVEKRLAAS